MVLRRLMFSDSPDVLRVQREAYEPPLCEPEDVFRNKMDLFPEGAVGCFEGDVLHGYLFAVAWRGDAALPLGERLDNVPPEADVLFIHDVAVSSAARGRGVGRLLADHAIAIARGRSAKRVTLVAVQSAEPFWERLGFRRVERIHYGPGVPATKMALDLL